MATAPTTRTSDNPRVHEYYLAQFALAEAVRRAVARAGVDGVEPSALEVIAALVFRFSRAAIALASDYYLDVRDLAGVTSPFTPPVTDPMTEERIAAYIAAGLSGVQALGLDDLGIESEVASFAEMLTANAGSDQIFASIAADRTAVRWARVTRPGACSFCLMLATRGAVYRDESTATFRPHKRCRCTVEPLFGGSYEPPAHIREAQQLYSEATADLPSGADRLNAFRRAVYADRNTSR